jgi:hypothetical protein
LDAHRPVPPSRAVAGSRKKISISPHELVLRWIDARCGIGAFASRTQAFERGIAELAAAEYANAHPGQPVPPTHDLLGLGPDIQ